MGDFSPRAPSFQIRSKPTILRIVNPKTGEAVQLPSPTKDVAHEPVSTPPQSATPGVAISKHGSKESARLPGKSKANVNLPILVGGNESAKPTINGGSRSKGQPQKASPKKNKTTLSDRPRDRAEANELPPRVSPEYQWRPDIYAHAYVPEAFLAVNKAPAVLLSSRHVQAIDFTRYTSSFASPLFLPPLSSLQAPSFDGTLPVDSLDNLSIDNYEKHLSDCLVLDLDAQVPEIRAYDMFGVQLRVMDRIQELYNLDVPGLRENTPRVAFGDNVMVRQLVMDPTTKLPLAAPATGSTGYQISAVVVGVDRRNETLSLRINGCSPHLLICNVSFIVQTRWIKSLQRAVGSMAVGLKASESHGSITMSINQISEESTSSHEHDFGPIGTPIKSPRPMRSRHGYSNSVTAPLKTPPVPRNDYFGAVGTPAKTPHEARLRPQTISHENTPDVSINYPNQAWLRRMLFPEESDGVLQRSLPQGVFKRSWSDRYLNHEQKKAVDAILARAYGSIPFIINGPPGTGKTKTMVETVTQLAFDADINGALLVCAPSDSAADTLALRLRGHFEPQVMFRLNDFSRTFAEVPQELLPYCYIQDDIFNLPPLPELMMCKIVIATCRTSDVLVQARVTNRDLVTLENNTTDILNPQLARNRQLKRVSGLHWSALLIDEAAQATEPEMLIPISVVAPPTSGDSEPNPIFVMAGDQHQLGPRIYDKSTTLRISLFERLSNRSIYASHPLARNNYLRMSAHVQMLRPAFVNLMRNYRSHPAILAIPSALFYANTLIPEATDTDELTTWPGWCGQGWPVLFACNGGIDDCEDIKVVGGGWYNIREARKAISVAKNLLESGQIPEQEDICIMSPFRSQVNVLRKMARKAGCWGLNIGPMDAFQGLESRFVILCTTRTRSRFLEEDTVKGAGIVNEPKKFNVAITRAKQGLVVLGNPWVLAHDRHWAAFMRFCWRNGLWQVDPDEPDERMVGSQEKPVNDWSPDHVESGIAGLERALVYKERQLAEHGSQTVRRFMSETGEDEVWRLGRLAEEALELSDG